MSRLGELTEPDKMLFGFVNSAILCGAVSQPEVQQWALKEIERRDEPPVCLFDIMMHEGHPADFAKFVGGGDLRRARMGDYLSRGQGSALSGIAIKRGRHTDEFVLSRKGALAALKRHPEIERRFREVFPFIEW